VFPVEVVDQSDSTLEKKNVLFLMTGPPNVPTTSLRLNGLYGTVVKTDRANKSWFVKSQMPVPCNWLVPDLACLLRSNLIEGDPAVLWERYIQLTQIEAAFKALKSEMGLRPIYHQLGHRVEAHIFIAFLAYCLLVTLKNRLQAWAPGLTPKVVLEKLSAIQMLDVYLPTTDGRYLVMPRYTQPEPDQAILLHKLQLTLPAQPPPRIQAKSHEFPREALRL
jgi:hypothetical protein